MKINKLYIDNPGLFMLVTILFILSITLLVYGFSKFKVQAPQTKKVAETEQNQSSGQDGQSLSQFFQGRPVFTDKKNTDEYYLETDPFRESCSGKSVKGVPAVTYGTVCFR